MSDEKPVSATVPTGKWRVWGKTSGDLNVCITALRVIGNGYAPYQDIPEEIKGVCREASERLAEYRAAPAAQSEAREPVAWISPDKLCPELIEATADKRIADDWRARGWQVTPCYAAPQTPPMEERPPNPVAGWTFTPLPPASQVEPSPRVTKFWGMVKDEEGNFVAYIGEHHARAMLAFAPYSPPMNRETPDVR